MKNAFVVKVVADFANMVERNLGANRAGVCTVTVSLQELQALRELIAVGQAVEDFREQIYIIGQRNRD